MPISAPPPSWASIKNKPTTVLGFGITDMGSQSVSFANTSGNGGVTSLNGQTGAVNNTSIGAIGSVVIGVVPGYYNNGSSFSIGSTYSNVYAYAVATNAQGTGFTLQAGTWRCVGGCAGTYVQNGPQSNMIQALFVRIG